MLIIGLVVGGGRGPLLIGIGLGLAGLGGLELAIREHFAGFRSHSTLLAGVPAIAVLALLFYAGPDSLSPLARVGLAAGVFAASVYGLATMFRRKAGVAVKLR
jgi:ABC-type arginine transport system permease subunit